MSLADRVPSLKTRLSTIYQDQATAALAAIDAEFADLFDEPTPSPTEGAKWDERDVVLITYADQLSAEGATPLAALREWLVGQGLDRVLSTVHLLPFCPYSSDDGFSVIDYLEVDPNSGTWDDIRTLGDSVDLMYDLVLNHISQHSEGFAAYKCGEAPYDRFFIEADPTLDYSQVVRPRSLPLLHEFETNRGPRHVWTTFSEDQIDLNYEEPLVLARMLRILVEYARRGARIVRLDAVTYLWKRLGTNCVHLRETHEVVKLMRDVLAAMTPRTLVLTETNVPHEENISYFGQADEAHMVYNFSLPPLLLEAFLSGDASAITAWLRDLDPPPAGCTFFNFTASHDGIGVRPLEGLVSDERLANLVDAVNRRGGIVNTRRQSDGTDTPYELCITYFSALAPEEPNDELHVRRFLASQAVMLALQGMPAVYFQSLLGASNDVSGAEESGIPRRINRHKYKLAELDALLANGAQRQVFDGLRTLIEKRAAEPAFHPDAPQEVIEAPDGLLAFQRTSLDGSRRVCVVVNVSGADLNYTLPTSFASSHDLLSDVKTTDGQVTIHAGRCVWMTTDDA